MVLGTMTERDPLLEPFDALIGTWATEATHPQVDEVAPGSITFEWWEGGRFLIHAFPVSRASIVRRATDCSGRSASSGARLSRPTQARIGAHADPIGALWSMFDLLPEGRGSDRHPALSYS
jgi:hypothetical protein